MLIGEELVRLVLALLLVWDVDPGAPKQAGLNPEGLLEEYWCMLGAD